MEENSDTATKEDTIGSFKVPLINNVNPCHPMELELEPATIERCKDPPSDKDRQDSSENASRTEQVKPEQVFFNVIDSDSNIVQVQSANKQKKVNLTAPDDRPKIYHVSPPQITEPLKPWMLPEAFSGVPLVGVVKDKAELEMAQRMKIKEFVGDDLNDEQFERLELYCSPENLALGSELKFLRHENKDFGFDNMDISDFAGFREVVGEAESLQTIKKFKMRIEMDDSNVYARKLKYRGFRYFPLKSNLPVTPEEALVPGKDLLFRIRVSRPYDYNPRSGAVWSMPSISRCPIFAHDVLLSGRNTLTAIRDAIPCVNETNLRVDISKNPTKKTPVTCKGLFPSGFLFINNAFYIDRRRNCRDLTAPIVEWARKNHLGDFPTHSMDMRLDQLTIKLGFPDVYVHQGNCEHTFTFAEVRLVTASDPLNPSAYPTQTFISKSHEAYCTTCADRIATRLVAQCVRVPFDPAFMCDNCFDMYLYDKDGNKVCDFVAYDYCKE